MGEGSGVRGHHLKPGIPSPRPIPSPLVLRCEASGAPVRRDRVRGEVQVRPESPPHPRSVSLRLSHRPVRRCDPLPASGERCWSLQPNSP
jgi:hypothetical protein